MLMANGDNTERLQTENSFDLAHFSNVKQTLYMF